MITERVRKENMHVRDYLKTFRKKKIELIGVMQKSRDSSANSQTFTPRN